MNDKDMVYVVDDDEAVRDSLAWLLEGAGYRVQAFDSAESFLDRFDANRVSVLVLDIRMPGMTGLELQEVLTQRGALVPIIFITGHGDVPMAVQAMKLGAADFLEKPFNETILRELVAKMMEIARVRRDDAVARAQNEALVAKLTQRERQVLERIMAGRLNKQIADDLSISIKTVEAHRASIMTKLDVNTVAELMRVVLSK
ncbi:response regulator transcription factor [Piscinibacterium candidicorallinum]|uniref:Response regulator transcription factor n=1 Tax=Piscinibacterium candidicorallinum TaxID=1793872 RepID=A0ABV7GY99_9BURK